jgi:hypothetical protein
MTRRDPTPTHRLALAVVLAAWLPLAGCDSAGPTTPSYILITEVSPQQGGTVTRSQSGEQYSEGTQVDLTAEPANGWAFDGWEGDVPSDSTGRTVTITMTEDKTARALFREEGSGSPLPSDRVRLGGKEIFLSGGNVAWIRFARDIGPGTTELATFESIFQEVQANGGNAMRLWLHTNGQFTPAWNDSNSKVTGPGEGTIADLRGILDLAEEHDVGMELTLWSFDMLASDYPDAVVNRNYELLTQPDVTQTYIDSALVPMVEQLGGHPAIIGWEIFNEPEGMTEQYGFSRVNRRVTMSDVQRFVNLTAGAIHRTDPDALVTNGTWSFIALTDEPRPAVAKAEEREPLTETELAEAQRILSRKFRSEVSRAEAKRFVRQLQAQTDENYYTDQRLIEAGGDPKGTLDYYNVHYYEWAGTSLSPFHHDKSRWNLDKPVVVGEFFMGTATNDDDSDATYGVEYENFYTTLYGRGYAGALGWQWFDHGRRDGELSVNWPRMLENMEDIHSEQPEAVEVSL